MANCFISVARDIARTAGFLDEKHRNEIDALSRTRAQLPGWGAVSLNSDQCDVWQLEDSSRLRHLGAVSVDLQRQTVPELLDILATCHPIPSGWTQRVLCPVQPQHRLLSLKIEGMTCQSCVKRGERVLLALPQVLHATLHLDSGMALVRVLDAEWTSESRAALASELATVGLTCKAPSSSAVDKIEFDYMDQDKQISWLVSSFSCSKPVRYGLGTGSAVVRVIDPPQPKEGMVGACESGRCFASGK